LKSAVTELNSSLNSTLYSLRVMRRLLGSESKYWARKFMVLSHW